MDLAVSDGTSDDFIQYAGTALALDRHYWGGNVDSIAKARVACLLELLLCIRWSAVQ